MNSFNIDARGNASPTLTDPKADQILKEKIALLKREFEDIDVNHDQSVTKDELLRYLDLKV